MARLEDKIAEIRDGDLRQTIATEVRELKDLLKKERRFGLVFERHLPELVPIYSAKIRTQSRVARKDAALTETYVVQRVVKGVATVKPEYGDGETSQCIPVSELVVVTRFGEAIFPALRHVESVLRGGDAPHHILIEADNYHALQLLEWLCAGKVDCIYIDPPYNTGAKDWKYNNDYVDKVDGWRHSKWLAMMQRRLQIAKRLLSKDGVLICTIDDNEMAHLWMLLDTIFNDREIVAVTIQHNPGGTQGEKFSVTNEYALFVLSEESAIYRVGHSGDDTYNLRRWGSTSDRHEAKNCFYPIYVKNGQIVGVGDIPADNHGVTTPGYSDFVVFRREGDNILIDLLEPHQGSDSLAKAHGLCKFAEEHGNQFGRIEWIKIEGSQIKRLNINSQNVRKCVMATNVDGALDTLFNTLGTTENMPAV